MTTVQQQQQAEMWFWVFLVGGWIFMAIVCAGIGQLLGQQKGRPRDGMLLGLLLGVFGLIVVALMEPDPRIKAQRAAANPHVIVQATSGPAGWHPDPYGKHQLRYFDGTSWREIVSDDGVQSVDAPPPPR